MVEIVKQGDTSHTLKTVNQEDKATKRIREEGTYTAETKTKTRFKIRYNKKPKLNPVNKEKETIEVLDEENTEKNTNVATVIVNEKEKDTPDTQMIERQQNMEASSSQKAANINSDIKEKYKEIFKHTHGV